MAGFIKGDVVCVPFPTSIPPQSFKKRPALVLSEIQFGNHTDYILCMITSQNAAHDPSMITLGEEDLETGSLKQNSLIRPNYVWTSTENDIHYPIGTLSKSKLRATIAAVVSILQGP